MTDAEPLRRTPREQAEEDAFIRLYGRWEPFAPAEVAELFRGTDVPWWVVGGWAIDAATGKPREHEDTDVSMLARDVPALVDHLGADWHVWNNNNGTLRPLTPERPHADDPPNQLWIRKDAASPWVIDVILVEDRDGRWVSRRDPQHVAAVEDVTWLHTDGVRYQLPEIVLLHKARSARPKDERDLRTAWPVLDSRSRQWLTENLERLHPGHGWLELMRSFG